MPKSYDAEDLSDEPVYDEEMEIEVESEDPEKYADDDIGLSTDE